MDFEQWLDQNAEWIADAFAKSNDAKAIKDILVRINKLWRTQADQQLAWREDTKRLAERISNLSD